MGRGPGAHSHPMSGLPALSIALARLHSLELESPPSLGPEVYRTEIEAPGSLVQALPVPWPIEGSAGRMHGPRRSANSIAGPSTLSQPVRPACPDPPVLPVRVQMMETGPEAGD